jgi:Pvc16 N-terminal domain
MIDVALTFLKDELNTYLHTHGMDASTVQVVVNNIVDEAGKYAIQRGQVGICLFNIDEERVLKSHLQEYTYVNGQHVVLEPDLKLNLHLLIASNMLGYDQSLKVISAILTYFQSHSHFTAEAYPALDPQIGKLLVELQSLNYEQLNQIWAFIGGKQLPSIIYKVRMVLLQEQVQSAVQPPIMIIDNKLGGR